MATHSSILAWKIRWTEEPGSFHGVAQSDTTEVKHARTSSLTNLHKLSQEKKKKKKKQTKTFKSVVLNCLHCLNKIPQSEWLINSIYFSRFWKLGNLRSWYWLVRS